METRSASRPSHPDDALDWSGRSRSARLARVNKPLRCRPLEGRRDQKSPLRRCFRPRPPLRTRCAGFASGCRSMFSELRPWTSGQSDLGSWRSRSGRLSGLLSGCPPTDTRPQARAKLGEGAISLYCDPLQELSASKVKKLLRCRGAELARVAATAISNQILARAPAPRRQRRRLAGSAGPRGNGGAGAVEPAPARRLTIAWPSRFWLYPRHFPPAGATARRGSDRGRMRWPGTLIQAGFRSMTAMWIIIACGLLAIGYGIWATASVMAADAGSPRMQEIAAAVREGAQAYLKRQYTTIGV